MVYFRVVPEEKSHMIVRLGAGFTFQQGDNHYFGLYFPLGVEKLIEVYRNKPSFADAGTQEETRQKLEQVGRTACVL